MKRCSSKACSNNNPQDKENFHKNKRTKDGLSIHCKQCNSLFAKKTHSKFKKEYSAQRKAYRAKDRDRWVKRSRENWLNKNYGLSIEEWNAMFEAQKGECKICSIHFSQLKKPLAVDHNHKTGKIRGLLCYHCNWLIGHAKERIEILNRTIAYLKHYE